MNTKLFSRQIGAIGKDTMNKLIDINVLVIGENAIALECIKCLSLLGINSINLLIEENNINTKYIKNKFYIDTDTDKISLLFENLIKSLNSNVSVKVVNNYIDFNYDAIILTNIQNNINILEVEKHCLLKNIKFLMGYNHNLYGYIYSNFNNHVISDKDGELLESSFINSFKIEKFKIILDIDKLSKNLLSKKGKLITNDNLSVNIDIIKSNLTTIILKKNTKIEEFLNKYSEKNVRFIEVKEKIEFISKNLSDTLKLKNYKLIDLNSSFNRDDKLYENYTKHLLNKKKWDTEFELDNSFFILESIIGAILSHEIIKITGKYTPLNTDLLFDFSKLRGNKFYRTKNSDLKSILDKNLLKKMQKQKIFMVGCGALGCEISKNLAMLDFSTVKKSLFTVTDMDTIELSNLNRQFLFRKDNINDFKSSVLKKRINIYNPNMNINSLDLEVSDKNLDVFSNKFFQNHDIIINALDNIEARKYVDSRCVLNEKALFESGTLGSKCNTQSIIPYKTATYSEIIDVEEKSIPMCTVKNFPHKIEHCVEWSLQLFEEIFTSGYREIMILQKNNNLLKEILENENELIKFNKLRLISIFSILNSDKSFKNFMIFSNLIYEIYFRTPISNILKSFPKNLKDCNGKKFWTGNKLQPISIDFIGNVSKEFTKNLYELMKLNFIIDTWNDEIYNSHINIDLGKDFNFLILDAKLHYDEKKKIMNNNFDQNIYNKTFNEMILYYNSKKGNRKFNLQPIDYDKDNDIHLKIMHSFSNLRAEIYGINTIELIDTQLISGKIIPALSTTTTIVAGFVIIEILKYLSDIKSSDLNVNLGINSYTLFDSQKPSKKYNNMFSNVFNCKIKTIPENFNTWSRLKILGNENNIANIEELLMYLEYEFEIIPDMLNIGKRIIYQNNSKNIMFCKKKIMDLYKELNIPLWENLKIDIGCFSEEGLPLLTPPIIFKF
jgi:ubiquitin-activating enzyme E1